jgi:hypothetical protein
MTELWTCASAQFVRNSLDSRSILTRIIESQVLNLSDTKQIMYAQPKFGIEDHVIKV